MTREKIAEMLSETICVPMEQANAALEESGWNVHEAARRLLREQTRAKKAEVAEARRLENARTFGAAIRGLAARIRQNSSVVCSFLSFGMEKNYNV